MFNALSSFLHLIVKALVAPSVAMLAFGGHPIPAPVPDLSLDVAHLTERVQTLETTEPNASMRLGASNDLPTSVAIFSTSLLSAIGSSDTSMTLVSAAYNNGASTLASSTYDFVIDEGTASQEFVSADCTATVCTNMTRGLDWLTGTSTVSTLKFTHRRGSSVKITDAPILLKLNSLATGKMGYPNQVGYKAGFASTSITVPTSFADKDYVDSTAFNGAAVINGTALARGVVQLASTLQGASSTASCSSGAACVIPASSATSTYNSATAALRVVVTQNNGKIDPNFIPTLTGNTFASTTLTGTTSRDFTKQIDSNTGYQSEWYLLASSTIQTPTASMTLSVPARQKLTAYVNMSGTLAAGTLNVYFNGDQSQCCTRSYNWATSTGAGSDASMLPLALVTNPSGTATTSVVLNISTWLGAGGSRTFVQYSGTYLPGTPFSVIDAPAITPFTGSGVWSTTTPQQVTQITFVPGSGNIAASSSVYIYGSAF